MKYGYEKLHKFERENFGNSIHEICQFFPYIMLFIVASVLCVILSMDYEHNVKLQNAYLYTHSQAWLQ